MADVLNAQEAVAVLNRSALPAVVTEGATDYRAMRKIEERLSDCGVDFLPLGGKSMVLEVWSNLSAERRRRTVVLLDLDMWLFYGVPDQYIDENVVLTRGYSIENDIALDFDFSRLMDSTEMNHFRADLDKVAVAHAIEIEKGRAGGTCEISKHPNQILSDHDASRALSPDEARMKDVIVRFHKQALRGHTLMQLLTRHLSHPRRKAKFSYHQLMELGSMDLGECLLDIESRIRRALC